jgi:subtilisin family serine protease
VQGAGFGWLQGTSMSAPNATGVAALTLAAHPELLENPSGLLAKLQVTARKDMVNRMDRYLGLRRPSTRARRSASRASKGSSSRAALSL